MLGLSSMMLVIGLITDKRNAAEDNQTKWILDALMIGWCAPLTSALKKPQQHKWKISLCCQGYLLYDA